MKFLSIFLVFVFLLSCTTSAQENKNPLAGTTWELTSGKWSREDTTFTFPASPYDQTIIVYGKTHFNLVAQDTSRNVSELLSATYTIDGNNYNFTIKMHPIYEAIGTSVRLKLEIEGDQLIKKAAGIHAYGYEWKEWHSVWKKID